MASHFSGTNGSLVHATASRPIIPTNRRRQPTIERGFSAMKIPIISLEQDLDKSHLNEIVAKETVKLQTKPDSNRPESIKRRSLQKPGVGSTSTRPELALTTSNGNDTKQLTVPTLSNNQPQANTKRRHGFPLFSPVSRQTGKSGGSKSKGFFAQGEAIGAGGSNAAARKDGGRLFRLRFGKNKLSSARPKSSNQQLDLEFEANTVLKDVDSSAVVLQGDDHEQDEGFSAQAVTSATPQDDEKQTAWTRIPEAVQQQLAGESSESPSAAKHVKHVDSERMTKSKSAKELAERARVAAAELRKSVNAANAATFSSFSRKTEAQGGSAIDHQNQGEDISMEETQELKNVPVQEANVQVVPLVSPLAPSTIDQFVEGKEVANQLTRAGETVQEQLVQEKEHDDQQSNVNDKKNDANGFTTIGQAEAKSETSSAPFQLLSSSWTPIQRNSVLGGVTNEADIPISAHRMSVLEKQAPAVPSAESGRRLSNFAGMLTEVPVRASPGSQLNPGLEISMIDPSSNKEEEEESPNKSRLAAFLSQTITASLEPTSSSDDVSRLNDENKSKPAETASSTSVSSSGLVKSVVSRLSVKATLPPSVLRMQTPPSKSTSSNRGSIVGDPSLSKSIATSPVTVAAPTPPRTEEEIKTMVERNIARMAAFLESVRAAKEAAAKAAEAAKAPPPEQEKPKKAFLKAYLAATASHNAKVRGEPDPATLEPQQPLSRLAAFLAEITPPPPAASAKPKRGKPFFRYPSSSAPQTPSAAQPKAPQQPSRLSMFLSSSSSSSKSTAKIETPSKPQVVENPKDSFPSDVETYGDRLRTQYIHVGNKQARSADEDVSEKKDVAVAQKDVPSSADSSGGARRNSKLVQSSVFRRPSLPRAVSSPSIRDAQPSSNSPKTRSRKNSSASPKPAGDKKSPVIAKSVELEDKRVGDPTDGRSETVKSVSLKDFSLKQTLEKYQRSASGKGKKLLLGENDDVESQEERRRPSLVNSMSLKNVSLAETLAMYQANSSRSLTSKSNSSN